MQEFWEGKKVLVTGHTGFKGSWLVFWLKRLGANVCGFALAPDGQPNLFENLTLETEIESIIGDVRDSNKIGGTFNDFQPEIVLHLAAQSLVRRSYKEPVETFTTNVIGTVNVLEAVRSTKSVKAVVIITTDKVYENKERQIAYSEGERLGGFDPYSSSKACAELAVAAYRNSFFEKSNTLIATARAGNVIGGGDWSEDRLVPDVFRSLIFGKELEIRNPGAIRPWQHVLESLAGYKMLAERLYKGEKEFAGAWNFGPSESDAKPVSWILDEIEQIWNESVNWQFSTADHPHEAELLKLNSNKANDLLKWTPKLRLKEGVALTAEWYRGFKDKKDLVELTNSQISFYQDIGKDEVESTQT